MVQELWGVISVKIGDLSVCQFNPHAIEIWYRPLKPNLVVVAIHIMNIINAGPLHMLSTYYDVWVRVERLGT